MMCVLLCTSIAPWEVDLEELVWISSLPTSGAQPFYPFFISGEQFSCSESVSLLHVSVAFVLHLLSAQWPLLWRKIYMVEWEQ